QCGHGHDLLERETFGKGSPCCLLRGCRCRSTRGNRRTSADKTFVYACTTCCTLVQEKRGCSRGVICSLPPISLLGALHSSRITACTLLPLSPTAPLKCKAARPLPPGNTGCPRSMAWKAMSMAIANSVHV